MSVTDIQELLKREARDARSRIDALVKDDDDAIRRRRILCIYAGMITETLLEYDEPDTVMDQTFYRIADLLQCEPEEDVTRDDLPSAFDIDHDTELGRQLAHIMEERVPKGLDDVHEIAIGMIIHDLPEWAEDAAQREHMFFIIVESVLQSLIYEMAVQDFGIFLNEELIEEEGHDIGQTLAALAGVSGQYMAAASLKETLPDDAEHDLSSVMAREAFLHGVTGTRNWDSLAAGNDPEDGFIYMYMEKIFPETQEFFDMVGLEDMMSRAVAVAKAVGRLVAEFCVDEPGLIHPHVAKSQARTGMILGMRYRPEIAH